MPRPRTPLAKAAITGQTYSNSTRFKGRKEPRVAKEVGDPPSWMSAAERKVWDKFKGELPWLNNSHRALIEIACSIRARLIAGEELSVAALTLLRQCLGSLGASPVDSSKIYVPGDENDDPADKYFR